MLLLGSGVVVRGLTVKVVVPEEALTKDELMGLPKVPLWSSWCEPAAGNENVTSDPASELSPGLLNIEVKVNVVEVPIVTFKVPTKIW